MGALKFSVFFAHHLEDQPNLQRYTPSYLISEKKPSKMVNSAPKITVNVMYMVFNLRIFHCGIMITSITFCLPACLSVTAGS